MRDGRSAIITARQFAVLWFATGIVMLVFTTGWVLVWWTTEHPLWWLGLVLLMTMALVSTVEYYLSEVRPA